MGFYSGLFIGFLITSFFYLVLMAIVVQRRKDEKDEDDIDVDNDWYSW